MLYELFLISHKYVACPTHFILLTLAILIIFGEERVYRIQHKCCVTSWLNYWQLTFILTAIPQALNLNFLALMQSISNATKLQNCSAKAIVPKLRGAERRLMPNKVVYHQVKERHKRTLAIFPAKIRSYIKQCMWVASTCFALTIPHAPCV